MLQTVRLTGSSRLIRTRESGVAWQAGAQGPPVVQHHVVGCRVSSSQQHGSGDGACGAARRWLLHVEDTNPHSLSAHGWLEDTRKVAKYVMSDADYARRENTYRAYKEQRRKARLSEGFLH